MNKAKCKNCGDILHSKHRHDYITCSCRRYSDKLADRFFNKLVEYKKEIDEVELEEEYMYQSLNISIHLALGAFESIIGHGIFIDGGDDYQRAGGNLDDLEYIDDEE